MKTDEKEKKCGIYLRVSTEEQHPENKIADVRKFAEALKYEVFEVYVDRESGSYSDRREFQRMMIDAENGKFLILFIWAVDRFSREGIEATLGHIKRLKEAGVAIKSYQESWLDTSTEGISELLIAILSWAAKQELKRFYERSKAGKATRLAGNKLIGCYPPYGYIHVKRDKKKGVDARFEIHPEEAKVVRRIFKLYLECENVFLVTKKLCELGIQTRGKGDKPKFFHSSTVRKILKNEAYIGKWYYGKTSPCIAKYHIKEIRKSKKTGRRINPKSEWKLIEIPPIVDDWIFNKAKQILKEKYRRKWKESKFPVLCKGLIKCVDCGRRYGAKGHHNSKIYRCPQINRIDFNEPACHSRSMVCHKLDSIVWDYISNLIQDKEKIKESLLSLKEKGEKNEEPNKRTIEALLLEKEDLKAKISKILDLYSDDEFSKDRLKAKLSEIEEKEIILDNKIKDIKRELERIDDIEIMRRGAEELCSLYRKNINDASFEEKRYVVSKWVKEINLFKDRIVIKVDLPKTELIDKLSLCPTSTFLAQRS